MKKKALLSSILVIALCLCLVVGSTFALFTSTSKLSVSVTSANVELLASIEDLAVFSALADEKGTLVDENDNTYRHEPQVDKNFSNGGTVVLDGAKLALELITPGDRVDFTIKGENKSNVKVQYRYVIECIGGQDLAHGLVVSINGERYPALSHYISAWMPLEALTAMPVVPVTIELPVAAGNEYQALDTAYSITVEAVQANGVVAGEADVKYINRVTSDPASLAAALNDPEVNHIVFAPEASVVEIKDMTVSNKILDGSGRDLAVKFVNSTLENVVVTNIEASGAYRAIDLTGATGDVTVENCTLISAGGTSGSAIGMGLNADLTVKNCDFSSDGTKGYAMYRAGSTGALTVTDCEFTGFTKSWVIMANGDVKGDVTITGCTFTDCTQGIFKGGVKGTADTSGTVEGVLTFSNNKLINCGVHNGNTTLFGGSLTSNRVAEGNLLDGVEYKPFG